MSRGNKPGGQGHKKNPRPGPITDFLRTDPLEAKDRHAQGPRTQRASVFQRKKGLRAESRKFFVKFLRPWPVFNKSKNSAILG